MIPAAEFVQEMLGRGYRFWSGVPCSYLKGPLRELERRRSSVHLVHAANEGDAVAACAGATLAGCRAVAFMQNSGLGNAVSPLSSLTWLLRLPVLLIVTCRGYPPEEDEPQHRLMGPATPKILEALELPFEPVPRSLDALSSLLDRAEHWMTEQGRPFALMVEAGTFEPLPAATPSEPVKRDERRVRATVEHWKSEPDVLLPSRREALERVLTRTPPERSLVISSTGYTSRELYALADRPNHLYMVGSMGCTAALAVGVSIVCPEVELVILEGDGSALMRLENLAMVGAYAGVRFAHLVLDNGTHESTGGQPTLSEVLDFAEVAAACGYATTTSGCELDLIDHLLSSWATCGPRLAALRTRPGTTSPLPRPAIQPWEVAERFSKQIEKILQFRSSGEAYGLRPEPVS